MAYETLLVENLGAGYATLVLNRPEKLNTLSIRMRRERAAAIDALEADPGVRVLIFTGAGRAFTVGLDLDEWAAPGWWERAPTSPMRWPRCSVSRGR